MKILYAEHDIHLPRRFWHIGTGLLGFSIYQAFAVTSETMGLGLLLLSAFVFLVEFIRLRHPHLNGQIVRAMGMFMRNNELSSYSGLPFYSLGCALSLLLFEENIAHLSLFFLIFIDPIAGCCGVMFGRKKIVFGKSLEGFLAGLMAGFFTTCIYCLVVLEGTLDGRVLVFSLCAACIGACAELFSFVLDDNLTLPFLSGVGLTLINPYFAIL